MNFFFTLENRFRVLLSERGKLNRELNLRLPVPKEPKRTAYITTLRLVRNHTVVDWGGPKGKNHLDSCAGRQRGFSWPSTAPPLTDRVFGHSSLEGASDRVLEPLPETHRLCSEYLKLSNERCADLLTRIVAHLPKTLGVKDLRVRRA